MLYKYVYHYLENYYNALVQAMMRMSTVNIYLRGKAQERKRTETDFKIATEEKLLMTKEDLYIRSYNRQLKEVESQTRAYQRRKHEHKVREMEAQRLNKKALYTSAVVLVQTMIRGFLCRCRLRKAIIGSTLSYLP